MKNLFTYFILIIFIATFCVRQDDSNEIMIVDNPHYETLDSLIHVYDEKYEPTGFAIGILEDGNLIYAKGFGSRNIFTKAPISINSVFHMASISKSFVSVAIMQLVEKNKLELDRPIVSYLPYFKLDDERYKKITVRHIISHKSGIPDVEDEEDYDWENPQYDSLAAERFVRSLSNRKLLFNPGEKRRYSNLAYDILADLILKVTGLAFETYMEENIFKPVEMNNTTFLKKKVTQELATSPHIFDTRNLNNMVSSIYPYNRSHAASSTLHSNILDMVKYSLATLNNGYYKGYQILDSLTYEKIWSEGLGWSSGKFKGHKIVISSGNDIGFNSYFIVLPEDSLTVIAMSNCEHFPCSDVSMNIVNVLLGLKPDEVKPPVSQIFKKTLLEKGIGEAIKQFVYLKENEEIRYKFDWDNLWYFGWRAIQQGNNDLAIEIFKMWLNLFPNGDYSYYTLGKAYMQKGEKELAIQNFDKFLEDNPHNIRARQYLKKLEMANNK
ncbi:MAG: serine hydrolase [bacterium]|nr:MAG: serine hydrolase [bacterium]